MDDARPKDADPSGDSDAAAEKTEESQDLRAWSNLWQVPTVLVSLLLIALAVRVAMDRTQADDFDGALTQVEQLLSENQLTLSGDMLRDMLEPHIAQAEPNEQARFHAAVADWTWLMQRSERANTTTNNLLIDRNYTQATDLELTLSPLQLERWVDSLISLDNISNARSRLNELNERAAAGPTSVPEHRRIDLYHRLIARAMRSKDIPTAEVSQWLQTYRTTRGTSATEQLWAIARQAEMRLRAGETRRAIDQLLIDIRRVEYAAEPGERVDLSEVYTMLGRAYYELGELASALRYLDYAVETLDKLGRSGDAVRGEATVIKGRIAMANDEVEAAYEHFDIVLREFVGTRSFLPALLGRAEASSILGSHDKAQDDYKQLTVQLRERQDHDDITPRRVAASLIDRHDAALATGDLSLALDYALIAERLFRPREVPVDLLFRVATSSRQLAQNMIADAGGIDQASVPQRHAANTHYQRAAEYYVQHARLVTGVPGSDDAWADSLWKAADSFDLSGLHDNAIEHFEEYLAGRSVNDPRRSDVTFRLAQSHHALMQYESAAHFYQQVIDEHPRSMLATQSHVPLARCLMAMGRRPEAEQQLRSVLSGAHAVQPDALDFRDALIELGTMYYNTGRYVQAIEHLDQAIQRYPEDDRYTTVLFRLADSYRCKAMAIAEQIAEPSLESPSERRRLDALRRDHLRTAMELFERIVADHRDQPSESLTAMEQGLIRSAFIHRADCAYYLDDYERAALLYDDAARRYSEHHSSMHALIQIVNSYVALGDANRASAAHRRALVRLQQLPDEAFESPDSLMDRQTWERWLQNTPVVPTRSARVNPN